MKSKLLMTLSAALLATAVASCGNAVTSSSAPTPSIEDASVASKETPSSEEGKPASEEGTPASEEDPSSEAEVSVSEEEEPSNWLENFSAKLASGNFTAIAGDDENGLWATIYGLGEDAFYLDYPAEIEEQYKAIDVVGIAQDGLGYTCSLVDGELTDFAFQTFIDEEATIYDYFLSPMNILGAEFEDNGLGEYTSTDENLIGALASLTGWGNSASLISEVTLQVYDDYESATLSGILSDEDEGVEYTLSVMIFGLGETSVPVVEGLLENLVIPAAEWPAEDVAAMLATILPESETVIPALEGALKYDTLPSQYVSYYGFGMVSAIVVEDPSEDYATVLGDASWTVRENGSYLSPAEDVEITFVYVAENNRFSISFSEPTILEWPAELAADIVETLAPDSETVIPAFDGGDEYRLYQDTEIDIYTKDQTLGETYAGVLVEAGWTLTDEGYLSPAKDILITFEYEADYGCYALIVAAYSDILEAWPTEQVAAVFGEEITDQIAAYTGEAKGFRFLKDDTGTAVQILVEEGKEEETVAAYKQDLTSAGWTTSGEELLFSPNDQLYVMVYKGEAGVVWVQFGLNPYVNMLEEFPLDKINEFASTNGVGYTLPNGFTLVDPSGKGYLLTPGTSSNGMPYLYLLVIGNAFDAWVNVLESFLSVNGYSLYSDYSTDTEKLYLNQAFSHYVQISYNASTGMTSVVFF